MGRYDASVLSSRQLARVGATAAILGGVLWTLKGVVILATGEQPPVVFALGPPLFAVGLIGLYARLGRKGGRAAAGLVLACVSLLLAGVLLVAWAFASDALPAGEDDFTPLSLVIAGAGFSFIAGLVLLGIAARHAPELPRRWRSFPLAVGVFAVPGIMIGGGLAELSERLLELPLVAFALGWIVIGYLIWPSNQAEQVATTPKHATLHDCDPGSASVAPPKRPFR